MATEENEALQERLKSALWYAIGKTVDEETLNMGVNATPQFIGALTEMVWAHLENVSRDLESFAQHASRKTITADDVLLLTRRNEGLEALMREFLDEIRSNAADDEPRPNSRPTGGARKGKATAKR